MDWLRCLAPGCRRCVWINRSRSKTGVKSLSKLTQVFSIPKTIETETKSRLAMSRKSLVLLYISAHLIAATALACPEGHVCAEGFDCSGEYGIEYCIQVDPASPPVQISIPIDDPGCEVVASGECIPIDEIDDTYEQPPVVSPGTDQNCEVVASGECIPIDSTDETGYQSGTTTGGGTDDTATGGGTDDTATGGGTDDTATGGGTDDTATGGGTDEDPSTGPGVVTDQPTGSGSQVGQSDDARGETGKPPAQEVRDTNEAMQLGTEAQRSAEWGLDHERTRPSYHPSKERNTDQISDQVWRINQIRDSAEVERRERTDIVATTGEEKTFITSTDPETGITTTVVNNADGSRTSIRTNSDGSVISTENKPPAGITTTHVDEHGFTVTTTRNDDGSISTTSRDDDGNWVTMTRWPGGRPEPEPDPVPVPVPEPVEQVPEPESTPEEEEIEAVIDELEPYPVTGVPSDSDSGSGTGTRTRTGTGTGTGTGTRPDDDDGDDPRDTPPPVIYGEEIDDEKICPQRDGKHKECIALLIDIMKHDNWRFGSINDSKEYLEEMECDIDYVAPTFRSVPPISYLVEKSIWDPDDLEFKTVIEKVDTSAQQKEARGYNQSQMKPVDEAIERHREKLRAGAILAIEMIYAHGSQPVKNAPCGKIGPVNDFWFLGKSRKEFHEQNYKAGKGKVCIWYVMDHSCKSYLSVRAVDELNNLGSTECSGEREFNPEFHAGYETDIVHACATDGTDSNKDCTNFEMTYLEDDINDVFEDEIARRDDADYGPGSAFKEMIPELGPANTNLITDTSTYIDNGYEMCVEPNHTRTGSY